LCSVCEAETLKWQGQCPSCGEWNSLQEKIVEASESKLGIANARSQVNQLIDISSRDAQKQQDSEDVQSIGKVAHYAGSTGSAKYNEISKTVNIRRYSSLDPELDRVLGGGLVPGSVVLLGGDPGIGKSTLLLTTASALAEKMPVLYVSGEESLQQIAIRGERLQLSAKNNQANDLQLHIQAETQLEKILSQVAKLKPQCLIIDSIQTLVCGNSSSSAGSVSQLRECTGLLVALAKQYNISIILIGHVTKQGQIAGPRVLEHMVDTVLYFESDYASRYRFIRAVKNRFGAADELAVYAMLETGLHPVPNPSAIFLQADRQEMAGSVCFVTRQGSRQLIVEIQALVDEVPNQHVRRVAVGLDSQRLNMLLAVLHKKTGFHTYSDDIYLNVVGGLDGSEIASDLPVLMTIVSAKLNKAWSKKICAFGEVGLSGEIRAVPYGVERIDEAIRQGFSRCLLPAANMPSKKQLGNYSQKIELIPVKQLSDVLTIFEA